MTKILQGDVLEQLAKLPDQSVQCVVTSPPYWGLRDYGVKGQLGLEATPKEYTAKMVEVFEEVRRVIKKDGTLWLNLGDSYASGKQGRADVGRTFCGSATRTNGQGLKVKHRSAPVGFKEKDLVGIPWRVAFALQAAGWYLRCDIIWAKPNPMPESVTDRPTKAHEYLFLLSKSERYYYDAEAIREPWTSVRDDMRSKGVRTGMAYLSQEVIASNDDKPIPRFPSGWAEGQGSHDILEHNSGKKGCKRLPENQKNLSASCDKQRGHMREHEGNLDNGTKADQQAKGRNKRSVWTIATAPYPDAHFATFPEKLVEPCVLAGSRQGDMVLDPFCGSGTTLAVAEQLGRNSIGIELNAEYVKLAETRTSQMGLLSV